MGKKHQPSYRVVVAEGRSKLGGPPVEYVGHYDPVTKKGEVNEERVRYWLGVGVMPSVTVHNMLVRMGVLAGPKIPVRIPRAAVETQTETQVAAPAAQESVVEGAASISSEEKAEEKDANSSDVPQEKLAEEAS